MNPKKVSIIAIGVISLLLIFLGIHWYIQNREQKLREDISFNKGVIEQLKERIVKDSLLALSLKRSIDSVMVIKKDTLKIYENKYIKINSVISLNANESIGLLARNLSKVDTTR